MQSLPADATDKPRDGADRLKLATNLASALCQAASETTPARKSAELDRITSQYGRSLNISKKQLSAAVEDSVKQFTAESAMFVQNGNRSRVLKAITNWSASGDDATATDETLVPGAPATAGPDTVEGFVNRTVAIAAASPASETADAVATLTAGIQDITNTLVGDYNLNDVLRIILETMYRGMGFSQVMLCTRDGRVNRLQARFGYGARIDGLLKDFAIPLDRPQDVFQLAVAKNVDLFIADSHATNIAGRIPAWYRDKVDAPTFLLLPLIINNKPVGLFYADRDQAGELNIEPEQLRLLKTLRNQAILAIRQKH
jgi:hypothetical protein